MATSMEPILEKPVARCQFCHFHSKTRRALTSARPKQLIVELSQRLRHDPHVADDRHEIHVAVPSWDDVLVQMTRQPRPGAAAQVHADVEALRRHGLL